MFSRITVVVTSLPNRSRRFSTTSRANRVRDTRQGMMAPMESDDRRRELTSSTVGIVNLIEGGRFLPNRNLLWGTRPGNRMDSERGNRIFSAGRCRAPALLRPSQPTRTLAVTSYEPSGALRAGGTGPPGLYNGKKCEYTPELKDSLAPAPLHARDQPSGANRARRQSSVESRLPSLLHPYGILRS